jgi:hypothetical protein
MTATRGLLTATAFVEIPTGVALLASPGVPASLLLGAPLAASAAIGVACWLVRHDGESRPGRGVVVSMLGYNVGVGVVLTHASLGLSVTGVLLWPAVGLHTALAAWCIACMRRSPLQRTVLSAK